MTDFTHLKPQRKDTAEYPFYEIQGEPTLIVKHAGESNKPYFNEKLRQAEKLRQRRAKVSVELIRDNRERDRELFPKYVVIGWKNVVDAAGNPVMFSKDDCEAFLRALDDEMFDALREYCLDASNFREVLDGATTAGNSQTA